MSDKKDSVLQNHNVTEYHHFSEHLSRKVRRLNFPIWKKKLKKWNFSKQHTSTINQTKMKLNV